MIVALLVTILALLGYNTYLLRQVVYHDFKELSCPLPPGSGRDLLRQRLAARGR
jgi:hypothetical protein